MLKNAARRRDPLRLTRRSGTWSLEFTRLVPVDEHLMRPERYRVLATPENLRTAAPSCPPARLQEAEKLLALTDDGSECVFELGGNGWAPVPQAVQPEQARALRELTAADSDMRSQLTLLRGLHDALLARVAAMEALVPQKTKSAPPPAPAPPAALGGGPRRVPSRRDMMAIIQPQRTPRFDLSLEALREPDPRAESYAATAAAATLAGVSNDEPGLALPPRAEVVQCLEMLAADVTLSPADDLHVADPSGLYMARLVDDAQETLAVILLDQRASAALGGALLGLPLPARDEQAEHGLADDTLEALNEVCNNLGGLIKRANPTLVAALQPLKACDRGTVPWLESARKRLGFVTPDGGVLRLAAR
jgi:hypothetical protein